MQWHHERISLAVIHTFLQAVGIWACRVWGLATLRKSVALTLFQDFRDFVVIGETSGISFREHEFPVFRYVEDSLATLNQGCLNAKILAQLGCKPCSLGLVVSHGAVDNLNCHGRYV